MQFRPMRPFGATVRPTASKIAGPDYALPSPRPVYVDEAIHAWRGRMWCHMFSEDLEVLHAIAARIGLRRDWFQKPPKASWPHYDLTAEKRFHAIQLGALVADRYRTLEVAWTLQGRMTPEREARLAELRSRRQPAANSSD